MMNEIEFGFGFQLAALALVLLLIIILIFFIVRRKISKRNKIRNVLKIPEPIEEIEEIEEIKPVAQPLSEPKPDQESIVASQTNAPLSSEPFVETQTNEQAKTPTLDNLPQDSMLRRHALANLRVMIESLKSPRPTELNLCRHYDSMLNAEFEQCLNDKAAMEQLICNYEEYKKH